MVSGLCAVNHKHTNTVVQITNVTVLLPFASTAAIVDDKVGIGGALLIFQVRSSTLGATSHFSLNTAIFNLAEEHILLKNWDYH